MVDIVPDKLKGRNKRLYNEWIEMDKLCSSSRMHYAVERSNHQGLPIAYRVYYETPCFCGVEDIDHVNQPGVVNAPIMASHFEMLVTIPDNYPCIDGMPKYYFTPLDAQNNEIAMPWHPNIKYFGMMAGRVCLNISDCYAYIAHCVARISRYLSYELYHADCFPPYPEDMTVAQWVRDQALPNSWLEMCKTNY